MRVIGTALISAVTAAVAAACGSAAPERFALRGTILTPNRVIADGVLVIDGARIHDVADHPAAGDVPTIDTGGIILPGLIDLHNHPQWNALPRWHANGVYRNRDEWTRAPLYLASYVDPERALRRTVNCELTEYAEIKAIVGGATSMRASPLTRCSAGLVRNMEVDRPLAGTPDGALSSLIDVDVLSAADAARLAERLRDGNVKRLFVHVGEGRADDPAPRREFQTLVEHGLLTDRTVLIHGTGFGDAEFDAVRAAGAALVWSPRSALELYGETTSITMAVDRGIPVALAPDWSITGSDNMLDELRTAAAWSARNLGGALDEAALVRMATADAAKIAGVESLIGAIAPGRLADVLVIRRRDGDPYRAVVSAHASDVRLVMVGGKARFGTAALMRRLHDRWDVESIDVCGESMLIDTTADRASLLDFRYRFSQVRRRLSDALANLRRGMVLAPLVECP